MRDEYVIWDSEWRFDEEGLEDYVSESEWLEDESESTQREAYADYIFELKEDERANLDIPIDGTLLAYGTQQRWNGPNTGADPLGNNVNTIFDFDSGDEIKYYVADGDVWARAYDHDGATLVVFRYADADYIARLEYGEAIGGEESFFNNTESIADLICGVYGW